MYWIAIIVVALCLTLFLVWASADVGSNVYLRTLCRGDRSDRVVSITFDDGPHATMTPCVLDTLKRYDVRATFFLIGRNVEQHPEIVRRMVSEGHTIANHTYSHLGVFPLSGAESVATEIKRCGEAIATVSNRRAMLFRMPFGVTNPIIGRVTRRMGLRAIGWSIRSLDTMKSSSRERVCQRVVRQLHPGAIILLHDRCEKADELLAQLITAIVERGYRIIPLEEMLNIDVYEA